MRRPSRAYRNRYGFTLIELLVVIGIIALLISILMPALHAARERANQIKCQSNLRTLMLAFTYFANDHRQHLPGTNASMDGNHDHDDWLMGDKWGEAGVEAAP